MGVDVYRHIEVKRKKKYPVVEELKDYIYPDNYIVQLKSDKKFYKYHNLIEGTSEDSLINKWESIDEPKPEYYWELLKFYSDYNVGYVSEEYTKKEKLSGSDITLKTFEYFSNRNDSIRNTYLSTLYGNKYGLTSRGYPNDVSPETKELLARDDKWAYNKTYVYLSEWEKLLDSEREVHKNELINIIDEINFNKVNKKLDYLITKNEELLKSVEDDDDFSYRLTDFFDETIWDIRQLQREIDVISFIVDEIYGYISSDDIRIIYYFCH